MSKIKIEDIREELSKEKWKVLSEEYKNLDTEMIFECEEGHQVRAPWKKFRTKRECPICKKNVFKNLDIKSVSKAKGSCRVLALDQATYTTGYAIFDDKKLVKYGIFNTELFDETARNNAIKNWLINVIANWNPDLIAIEGIQYQANFGVTTFQALARLQGVLMELCYSLKIPFKVCPTNTWRAHSKIKGRTRDDKKKSAQLIVKDLYDISVTNDISDAILIGKYMSDISKTLADTAEDWE